MEKLETKIGTMYLDYSNLEDKEIVCWLCDSDKKIINTIYDEECIKGLKEINSIGDLVDLLALQNCTWGQSIEELTDEINEAYYNDPELVDEAFTVEEMKEYEFLILNRVGSTYFIINFEN